MFILDPAWQLERWVRKERDSLPHFDFVGLSKFGFMGVLIVLPFFLTSSTPARSSRSAWSRG